MYNHLPLTVVSFHLLILFVIGLLVALQRRPESWHTILAIFLGLLVALLTYGTENPQGAIGLLLLFGVFLGFTRPDGILRWVFLLGMWIPVTRLVLLIVESQFDGIFAGMLLSVLALIPAAMGVLVGALVRRSIRNPRGAP